MEDNIEQNQFKIYADYLREQGKTDEEIADILMFEGYERTGELPAEKGWGGKSLDMILKGLDYGSAVVRGGAGLAAQEMSGKNLGLDLKQVLSGDSPDTAELLRRGEVGELGSVDLPLVGKVTGRGAIGFAGDVLADPLTYIPVAGWAAKAAKGGGKMAKAGKAARVATSGIGDTITGAGKKMWKSGLKNIDAETMKYGKEPVSDVLMKYGITGTQNQVYNKMDDLGETLLKERNAILDQATKAGARADVKTAMKPAEDFLTRIKAVDDPTIVDSVVPKLESTIDQYKTRAARPGNVYLSEAEVLGPTPSQMSQWKSGAYAKVGDQGYREAMISPMGVDFQKTLARGMKEATEESVGKSLDDAAKQTLKTKNDELGRILTSKDRQLADAAATSKKDYFTSVDGMLLANPAMLAGKKTADIFKTTYVKTKGGKALKKMGENTPEAFWRQLLLQPTNRDSSIEQE